MKLQLGMNNGYHAHIIYDENERSVALVYGIDQNAHTKTAFDDATNSLGLVCATEMIRCTNENESLHATVARLRDELAAANEGKAKLAGQVAEMRKSGMSIMNSEMKRTAECIRLRDLNTPLLEFFNASSAFNNTVGHEDATAADENAAEARYETAHKAATLALTTYGAA